MQLPFRLLPTLRLAIGDVAIDLTPRQGLRLAEALTRASFRRVAEEAVAAVPLERNTQVRKVRA